VCTWMLVVLHCYNINLFKFITSGVMPNMPLVTYS
jgi:hypothetical protein